MPRSIDLTGRRFGRLVAVARQRESNRTKYLCECDCGNNTKVFHDNLITGHTQSCGCLSKETHTKYKNFNLRLYKIHHGMVNRCSNPLNQAYVYYGGRGISVIDEWLDFDSFYNWAVRNGYSDNLTIDRIDTNGNYSPTNCKWSTKAEQNRNKRDTRNITYRAITKCVTDWAKELNISPTALTYRLNKGWGVERTLTTPSKRVKQ